MSKSYAAAAPDPGDFLKLLDAMGDMMKTPVDWTANGLKINDAGVRRQRQVSPGHEVKFYQLLGGGLEHAGWQRENMSRNRLASLPGLTHHDIFLSPKLPIAVVPFLDGKVSSANRAK